MEERFLKINKIIEIVFVIFAVGDLENSILWDWKYVEEKLELRFKSR